MKQRIVQGVQVQTSSGNVFADLGLPDAVKLKIQADLVIQFRKAIRSLGLTQPDAAVVASLEDLVKRLKRGELAQMRGQVAWEGDLNQMPSSRIPATAR